MIERKGVGDYARIEDDKHRGITKRQPEDFDLRFEFETITYSYYVLDKGEWWDPRTSTQYFDGLSRHAMWGPAVIEVYEGKGSMGHSSTEFHVNDPRIWANIQRNIRAGVFNAQNCCVAQDAETIEIKPLPEKVKKPRGKKKAGV